MPTLSYPSYRQWLGIAKEATPGTAVLPAYNLLAEKIDLSDKITMLQDKGLRGSMGDNYGQTQGVLLGDVSFSGSVHPDVFGYLLANILGDLTVTGTAAPYTNAFSVLNSGSAQPVTDTLTWYYGPGTQGARAWADACLSDLSVSFDVEKGLLTYDAKGQANASAEAASAPVNTVQTDYVLPSWICTATLGGVANAQILSGKVDIKRGLTPYFTAQNSQVPVVIQRGKVDVSVSLVMLAQDETQITNYLANTQPSLDLKFLSGTGTTQKSVEFNFNQVAYKSAKPDTSKDAVEFQVDFDAIFNSTNAGASGGYSPVKATVLAALTSGTYA